MTGVAFLDMIVGYFKSPQIARNARFHTTLHTSEFYSTLKVDTASTSTVGIPHFFYIRILNFFWAPLTIFGLQYFLRKIKFRVEVLAWINPPHPLYKNLNKLKINCIRILGFFGLWESLKAIPKNHPYTQKNNRLSQKSALQKLKCTRILGFFGFLKMSILIFGLQRLTSKYTPAWPYRHDFNQKSSVCKLYFLEILTDFGVLRKCLYRILGSHP